MDQYLQYLKDKGILKILEWFNCWKHGIIIIDLINLLVHIDHFKADQNSHLYTALYNFLPPPKFPDPTIKLHKLPSRIEIFWLNPADFFLEILTSSSLSFWRGCIWFFNFIIEEHLNIYNYWDEVAKSIFSHLLSYFFTFYPTCKKDGISLAL